jgi:hypothetical protein
MRRAIALGVALTALAAVMVTAAGPAGAQDPDEPAKIVPADQRTQPTAPPSGIYDFKDVNLGHAITECPQARVKGIFPRPPEKRVIDRVEQYSEGGDDRRTNEEFFCQPQNETAIDVNPLFPKNVVAGANDYRMGWGTSGFYASNDSGQTWYTGIMPFPSLPSGDNLDGGGDPVIAFDRAGIAYYAEINFNRTDDVNGIFVMRSTNGGYTWNRPCVPINVGTPTDDQARCGGTGDPRQPGDGVVTFQPENDPTPPNGSSANFSVTFHDKEWMTTGPRPAGVQPVCFAPETRTPIPAGQPGCPQANIGVDRIYVTWTAFNNPTGAPFFIVSSTIEFSYSDDQGRSWSPRRTINGSAPFCQFAFAGVNNCDDNQFSVPTTHPETGELWVAFENFNTEDENQILVVHSADGGQTFDGPYYVTNVFDVNFPVTGANNRPDCANRGQQGGRAVLTNSCFRVPMTLAIVADKRGGAFNDNLHLVMSDNRNGTRVSTNTDVFYFKSNDGGRTWIGPTRVNNDASVSPANRDCARNPFGPEPLQPDCPAGVHTGNDQWWPWLDINRFGHLNVVFHDRRLDTTSTASEWPTSRSRTGNYLVWNWGAQCEIKRADSRECVAPAATAIPQPTTGVNPPATAIPPGAGQQFLGGFHNFGISDFPSNWDYCFRAGIFCGDYNAVAVTDNDTKAYAHWTDARNGRSSGGPTSPQAGRNPACEQSDVMVDEYSTTSADAGQKQEKPEDRMFDVTPCPMDSGEWRNTG